MPWINLGDYALQIISTLKSLHFEDGPQTFGVVGHCFYMGREDGLTCYTISV
jgi:hypothetical protein